MFFPNVPTSLISGWIHSLTGTNKTAQLETAIILL